MRFRVKDGKHVEPIEGTSGNNKQFKKYGKGDILESDSDLCARFPNKFERLPDDYAPPAKKKKELVVNEDDQPKGDEHTPKDPQKQPAKVPADGKESKETKKAKEEEEAGSAKLPDGAEDVTEEFPLAVEADLLVLKKGRTYTVADKDDPTTNIAEKHLKHDEVEDFLKTQVKKK